jgi:hypothetical protein
MPNIDHRACQNVKKNRRGEGVYDSLEVFPIISAHPIPLALHEKPSTLVYIEFWRYGNPTEQSEGGTRKGGGINMLTRAM